MVYYPVVKYESPLEIGDLLLSYRIFNPLLESLKNSEIYSKALRTPGSVIIRLALLGVFLMLFSIIEVKYLVFLKVLKRDYPNSILLFKVRAFLLVRSP